MNRNFLLELDEKKILHILDLLISISRSKVIELKRNMNSIYR